MTPKLTAAEKRLWAAAQRRAARLAPQMAREIQQAFAELRTLIDTPAAKRALATGNVDMLLAQVFTPLEIENALVGARDLTREVVGQGVKATLPALPGAAVTFAGMFNILAPEVIAAIRTLESKAFGTLSTEVREVVRAFVENGLRDGVNPREIARALRETIGLAPNQLEAVNNFERALRGDPLAGSPFTRQLRDRRFDAAIRKGGLTEEQIQKMVTRYRERFVAWNAETHARTATLDALRGGQRLAWQEAIRQGIVDGGTLWKRWVATMDERTRPEHMAAHGIEVPFDALFPVDGGVLVPGENAYNCRCVAMYVTQKANSSSTPDS